MAHDHSNPKYMYDKYLTATGGPIGYWEVWCAAIDANEDVLNAVRAHRDNLMKMVGSTPSGGAEQ